ncbi:hypothetical protein BC89_31320 [Pseudomonas monteilii]|nr:hypothetical protein BC89_31320 [Pseudomonas monteilii]
MDVSLQSRIAEFEAAKLPKNLIGYIYKIGRQRSDFSDYREWKLYAALYETLRSLRGHHEFSTLAARLFEYLDRHPISLPMIAEPPKKALTRKEKKKRRAERPSGPSRHLSAQLKKSKPSTADMIITWKSSPTIGLGLESNLAPPPKARREDIKIDKHTQPLDDQGRSHILYAAGWSLKPSESQD